MGTNVAFRSSVGSDRVALENWLGQLLGDVPVASNLTVDPSELPADGGVDLVLVDLAPVEDRRPDRDLPTRLHVTYLVAPAHEDPLASAERLAAILAAAREQTLFELVEEPLRVEWWLAMSIAPRPCARIRTMLVIERAEIERAKWVSEPLVVHVAGVAPLSGTAVDHDGRPLRGAVVRLASTGHRSETDHTGRFAFPAVVADRPLDLTVTARGTSYSGVIPAGASGHLLVTCTPESP
ncbi:MAG: carboxypeptidase-like regulatory domain-containing protein [Acidimicrobiales bacterium]